MIKNILFDFAGVVMNLDLQHEERMLDALGLPDWSGCMSDPALRRILLGYLNGLIPWEDFLPQIRPFCQSAATDEQIFAAMHGVLGEVPPERLAWIRSLRGRYRVILLSNISREGWEICEERLQAAGAPSADCFDHRFLSYEMGLEKPDPAIYEEVFHALNIRPEETLYFDDDPDNIRTGRTLGMHAVQVEMNRLEAAARECVNL